MLKASWKSLLGRKVRLFMSTFAIVLGVSFVAGSFIFTDTLSKSFTTIFASSVGDVVVSPAGGVPEDGAPTTKGLPASLVDKLASAEGAARVDGNVSTLGVFVVNQNNKLIGGNGPPGIAFNYTNAPAGHGVDSLSIVEGHEPSGPDEVALDVKTADRAGYEIGDQIKLVTIGSKASLQPTLVGLADFANGGSTVGATLTIFDTPTAQDLFMDGEDRYSDAWVTAKPGVSQVELRDQVDALLPDGYKARTGDESAEESASQLEEAISFINQFLLIFAGISLVVGSFLIVNTFSILVAQRSRELALLRALGASRRQVTRSVLFEALVVGALGGTLGLGLGVLLAMGIRALFASFGLDLTGTALAFEPRTVVASYAVGITVTAAAAYLPARRSARIEPVAALRDDVAMPESTLRRRLAAGTALGLAGIGLMLVGLFADVPKPGYWVGGGILAALLGAAAASPVISQPFLKVAAAVYRRGFGSVGRLAGQNSLRNPRRTAATASALMIGLALVTTMAIVGTSSKASVDKTIADNFQGDVVVSNLVGERFSASIGDEIEQTDDVDSVTRLRWVRAEIDDDHMGSITGLTPGALGDTVRVEMTDGDVSDLRDGTIALSKGEAEEEDVSVGDTLQVAMPDGKTDLEVSGVYEQSPLLSSYTVTLGTLVDGGYRPADSFLLVDIDDGADTAAVQDTIEKQTIELPTVTVKDQEGFAAEQRAQFDQLLFLIYAMLGLALVIAVLGIVNTLALSVIERTREIGLLRAIGLSRRQLRKMIRLEAIVIAVLGALLGVVMGIVFGLALMVSLRDEGLEVISVPVVQLAVFVLGSAVVGVVAALLPARRAARLDVLRAIATE